MVGIDKISPVYPGRSVNPADEKRQKKKQQEERKDDRPSANDDDAGANANKQHVDEYA